MGSPVIDAAGAATLAQLYARTPGRKSCRVDCGRPLDAMPRHAALRGPPTKTAAPEKAAVVWIWSG